ncbi:hypothetical protein Syun_016394 [Stephania yunnanensis]|uniref:RRM domain-containing protein n=1 Tax=Stephania yunnanensis TaxID=152371 RepID=A0AAP0P1C8_9MAGN
MSVFFRKDSKVFVKNVSDDVELKEKFSKFGKVTSAKIMRDETGASNEFTFVCFSNPEEAYKAVSYFNDSDNKSQHWRKLDKLLTEG